MLPKFRGGRLLKTPKTKAGYPSAAWYTYVDESCWYGCQAVEYMWWGYAVWSGMGDKFDKEEGFKEYKDEFKLMKKKAFISKDKGLAKLMSDSEKGASYRLPTKIADGVYTGCIKCTNGRSYGDILKAAS